MRKNTGSRKMKLCPLDQIQAIRRHPVFIGHLKAWERILKGDSEPGYRHPAEDLERKYEPRSEWSALAEMEATRHKTLTLQEREVRRAIEDKKSPERGYGFWRILDVKPNFKEQKLNITIDLSRPIKEAIEGVEYVVRMTKKSLGIEATQSVKRPQVEPWLVWDEAQKGKTLYQITMELFGNEGKPTDSNVAKRHYAQVTRAYKYAKAAIERVRP